MSHNKARLFGNNVEIVPEWSTYKHGNKLGAAIVNGYGNIVELRNFNINQSSTYIDLITAILDTDKLQPLYTKCY